MGKTFIKAQTFYERDTGREHEIVVLFYWPGRKVYEVRVDDEVYTTAETRYQADDEIVDIIRTYNWGPCRPF